MANSKQRFRDNSVPTSYATGSHHDRTSGLYDVAVDPWVYKAAEHTAHMVDFVTPGWREAIARGEIVNNYMTATTTGFSQGGGSVGESHPSDPSRYYWYMNNAPVTSYWWADAPLNKVITNDLTFSSVPQGLEHLVRLECLANVDKTPYAFMEDILEFHKTIGFISDTFLSMNKILRNFNSLRNTFVRSGMSPAKAAASAWLQYRYALRPIWMSANNLAMALDDKTRTRPKRSTARSKREKNNSAERDVVMSWSTLPGITRTFHKKLTSEWKIRAGIIYEVSNPVYDFGYRFGVRPKDWPVGLYNILPYSFILEWFISFEKSLKALINLADPNVHILAGWVSMKEDNLLVTRLTDFTSSGGWQKTSLSADDWITYSYKRGRMPWTPSILDTIPVPELKLDFSKALDLTAIAIQLLR